MSNVLASAPGEMGAGRSERLVSVQILRGIAALSVVWLHLNVSLNDVRSEAGPSLIGQFAHTYQFGGIGVDIFFLISGFAMAFAMHKYEGRPFDFIRQRFLRVAPLAYAVTAVWLGILLLAGEPMTFAGIFSGITFVPVLLHYTEPTFRILWTLSFEFTFYILVMGALALRFGARQLLWIVAGLGTLGLLVTIPVPLFRWLTHPVLLEFALGIASFVIWRTVHLSRALLVSLGLLGAGILAAEALLGVPIGTNPTLMIAGPMAGPRLLLWALPSVLALIALLHWHPRDTWPVRFGRRLGDASYSIYLTHLIPVHAAAFFLPLPADLRWLVGFAAALGVGLTVHRHVERPLLERLVKPGRVTTAEIHATDAWPAGSIEASAERV